MSPNLPVRLGDAASFVSGGTPSRANATFYGGDIPWVTGADLGDGRIKAVRSHITGTAVEASAANVVPSGTVLLVTRTSVGKVAIADRDVAFSQDITAIRVDSRRLDTRYLVHFLRTKAELLKGEARGATIKGVTRDVVEALTIPMPPIEEQRRIAEMLDRADALRAKRRDALGLLDDLAQSIFHAAFTLDAQKGQWPIEGLRSVVRDGTLVTYGIVQAGPEVPGGVPYIRTGDLVDGEIKVDGLRRTAASVAAKFERSMVVEGDIVMSIRATVGTTALVTRELSGANLTQGTARISPGNLVRPRFLLEYLRSHEVQSWIRRQIKGATFLEITLGRLRELQVMLPPDELQCAYEQTLLVVDRLTSVGQRDLRTLDAFFASLQQRAFSGQL